MQTKTVRRHLVPDSAARVLARHPEARVLREGVDPREVEGSLATQPLTLLEYEEVVEHATAQLEDFTVGQYVTLRWVKYDGEETVITGYVWAVDGEGAEDGSTIPVLTLRGAERWVEGSGVVRHFHCYEVHLKEDSYARVEVVR